MLKPLLGVILFAANLLNCGKDVKQDPSTGSCVATALPATPPAAGIFTFSLDGSIDPCSVYGYVVGYQAALRVARATDGSFYVSNVPAGEVDIVINAVGTSLGTWLNSPALPTHGVRLKKVRALNGVNTEGGKIDLPRVGSIAGKVHLNGQTDHSGIDVYIPGTEYISKTDGEGRFAFTGVPVGEHNLYLEKDGYHRGQFEKVVVKAGSETTLDDATLIISTGASGFLVPENGASFKNSRDVSVIIGASEKAVLMKVSEDIAFTNLDWSPLTSTTSYKFDSDGAKMLYVKFADANGLESSPYSSTIKIDTTPPSVTTFRFGTCSSSSPSYPTGIDSMAVIQGPTGLDLAIAYSDSVMGIANISMSIAGSTNVESNAGTLSTKRRSFH
ncbi:MAG TPA: carboxypeptidase-like regulatory domain-containing protein [Oligoflexus sp.]|uniref:carboxypeptidase-like regulatory domain-containing protein n=1 Tax=Oligoflexus sp. TaxID=1971216 RepID=UPI002D6B36A5|nr:carboxypeptidase-like regulatory domain-containing protein [Oligoflexus sp.]HYX38934.1 carboxypeptidase-like regulatory domain-containing protein [Oligoflexus sp.]